MKPISAWHKYALRDEMTTDALNFRELAFRQTSSRPRPLPLAPWPHKPPPQPRALQGSRGPSSAPPGISRTSGAPCGGANPRGPLAPVLAPQIAGSQLGWGFHPRAAAS